jgi:hypothetical protein
MVTIKQFIFICFLCLFIPSCIGVAYHKKLNDNYYLSAMDIKEEMEIDYKNEDDYMFSVVTPTVFAVGKNRDFIIVKQHPRDTLGRIHKNIINYFIISLKDSVIDSKEGSVIGPLTLEEFNQKEKEFGLQNMKFKIVFKDLE